MEHMSDQSALPNLNANWVNAKGTLAAESSDTRKRIGPSLKTRAQNDRVALSHRLRVKSHLTFREILGLSADSGFPI